jgi:hypothetical protein
MCQTLRLANQSRSGKRFRTQTAAITKNWTLFRDGLYNNECCRCYHLRVIVICKIQYTNRAYFTTSGLFINDAAQASLRGVYLLEQSNFLDLAYRFDVGQPVANPQLRALTTSSHTFFFVVVVSVTYDDIKRQIEWQQCDGDVENELVDAKPATREIATAHARFDNRNRPCHFVVALRR